jgi:shikimate kinase
LKVFLIGLPGSGKSTLGQQLSGLLQLPFVDLDEEIEKKAGKPVREIFASKGEDFFRETEARILRSEISELDSFVMATGGGAPCFHDGMDIMNKTGITVFLDVPVEVILLRMNEEEKAVRPLLSSAKHTTSERLTQLREQRLKFYNQAKIILTGQEITVEEILRRIPKN